MKVEVKQWCPAYKLVVDLIVDGALIGHMVKGKVVRCQAFELNWCKEIHSSFCLVGKELLTQAS